ncbi:MAG: hypothetical protein KME08_06875 [Aphanothece sp. CMT-3BRIN-NPC111]|jgi:hypothetical protein|nr:hypothetical protein [Aphanothece sp. CMT-3BRIN-NPC111]
MPKTQLEQNRYQPQAKKLPTDEEVGQYYFALPPSKYNPGYQWDKVSLVRQKSGNIWLRHS